MARMLVMGANGFVGSNVMRLLVQQGHDVRIMVRPTSDPAPLEGLKVDRRYGDIFDLDVVREAMRDRDVVFYCVVDARAWLRNPAPLFRTNVEGLGGVLDIALAAGLKRFVFLSTMATIGRRVDGTPATEADRCNYLEAGGPYAKARLAAEDLVLRYAREKGLPAVAMCVATPFGAFDWAPTPHGHMVADAAKGRMPFYIKDLHLEAVDVEDAARAMILAGEKGRNGERYIVSERSISYRELFEAAAETGGVPPPRLAVPLSFMYVVARINDVLRHLLRRDLTLTTHIMNLMHLIPTLDHSKAVRELGWQPRPVLEAIRAGAQFALQRDRRARPT